MKPARSKTTEYRFKVVKSDQVKSEKEILDLADRLAAAGCDDRHLGGHAEGIKMVFVRVAESREDAMRSAVKQIEQCGLVVKRIELDCETIAA